MWDLQAPRRMCHAAWRDRRGFHRRQHTSLSPMLDRERDSDGSAATSVASSVGVALTRSVLRLNRLFNPSGMSKNRVIVEAVLAGQSHGSVARQYGISTV